MKPRRTSSGAWAAAPACHRLAATFYARVDRDALLRPLFPGKSMTCAIQEFAAFLIQFLGGPSRDSQRRWWLSLRESHLRFRIGTEEREAWSSHMAEVLADAQIDELARRALYGFFAHASAYVVNHGPAPPVSPERLHPEIARRWEAQVGMDRAVAAIGEGAADQAVEPARDRASKCDPSVLTGLLARMIANGQSALLDYVHEALTLDPRLRDARYAGRTLLHVAAGQGDLNTVDLLLSLGADPNVRDGGGHTPLYAVGNECRIARGAEVVRALVRAGANVNARDGLMQATALHMAARRDSVHVAASLLDRGADIEARDKRGDTPLRRAVNCNQTAVAALLLSRGADPHAKGSRNLTPLRAARTAAMRQLFKAFLV